MKCTKCFDVDNDTVKKHKFTAICKNKTCHMTCDHCQWVGSTHPSELVWKHADEPGKDLAGCW